MSIRLRKISTFLLLFIALGSFHTSLRAQVTQELFGKNRIQYKKFDWKAISTTNFEIYFYQEGNQAAYQAARYAESDFDRIADLLGYTPYSKTKIFIYNSFADLQQSNVGVSNEDALFNGQTSFVKSRVEVPFSGNQVDFKKDLSRGIAQVFISEMMFGGSLKDMVQSSVLLSLPDWYMSGAAAYVSEGWSLEMDDYMRDAILNKNIRKPAVISGASATLVGQSIWSYISERYGKGNISNILNLTRIIRNEETSISSTLGIPYSRFVREWKEYYSNNANRVAGGYQVATPDFKSRKRNRRGYMYNKVKLSPDGKYIAYSENYKGIYSVIVASTDKKSKQTVLKGGYKVLSQRIDRQIPLIAWQNNSSLVIIDVEKGKNRLSVYEVGKHRKRKARRFLTGYNQIADFAISKDGTMMVLSADKDGQSDIFLAGLNRASSRQITNDLYDDLYPQFVGESNSSLVFSSNRQTDSLSKKDDYRSIEDNFDIFLHDGDTIKKLTNSLSNASRPIAVDERTVYYLNDEKGVRNLYKYTLDNGQATQVTDFRQNIREYDINVATNQLAYYALSDSREYVGWQNQFDFGKRVNPAFSKRNEHLEGRLIQSGPVGAKPDSGSTAGTVEVTGKKTGTLEPGEVDTDNYQFDTDVITQDNTRPDKPASTPGKNPTLLISKTPKKDNITIRGPFPYQKRFSTNNVMSTLLINPLTGWGLQYDVTMNDMLEDHIIKVGGFINIDLRSNNFFGEYRYLKNRIDYGVRIDRKSIFISNENTQKYRFNKITLSASYPFSVSSRISASPFYIITRAISIGNSSNVMAISDAKTNYGGVRLEYVFDNTVVNGMNMIEGTRIKVKYENYMGINASNESFDNFSIDLRNYQKIHRDIVFATRLSYGQFGGNAPKKYLLGGMDNWLFNSAEVQGTGNPLARDSRDWYFLEFATNMRGFKYNKYFGEKYVLFNAELRMPIIKYFYRGPITSNFFRNLQFVAFTDVGTAWTGEGPFSRKNSLNTVVQGTEGTPFRATVTNFKNPFLTGYGAGVRTFLLGYYAKFDVAWGVEDYVVQTPMYYLTLGYDF